MIKCSSLWGLIHHREVRPSSSSQRSSEGHIIQRNFMTGTCSTNSSARAKAMFSLTSPSSLQVSCSILLRFSRWTHLYLQPDTCSWGKNPSMRTQSYGDHKVLCSIHRVL